MRCKDELDVVEATLRHLASQVDEILVADNLSTDGTRELLHDLSSELPLVVSHDDEYAHYAYRVITGLAREACTRGHEWVVPCDADEIWVAPVNWGIRDWLATQRQVGAVSAVLYNHVPTFEDDVGEANPVVRMGWRRRTPQGENWGRFAWRLSPEIWIAQGNHTAQPVLGRTQKGLVVHHFPYRNVEQFVRKARNGKAVYDATDLDEGYGVAWREHGRLVEQGEPGARAYFYQHLWSQNPASDSSLVYDPCPL